MSKHAPGPWYIDGYYSWGGRTQTSHIVDGDHRIVGSFSYAGTTPSAENLQLIVAAPDLLAALMEVEKNQWECEGYCQTCGNGKRSGHTPDCALAAAIKKAVGDG